MTLEEQIAHVAELRAAHEDAAERAKQAKANYEKAQLELWERMDGTGVKSINIRGTSYAAKSTIYGTVQDKEAVRRWAVDEGNAPELFEMKPRKGLVNERVRQMIDNGEELPEGLGFYTDHYVSQTKS